MLRQLINVIGNAWCRLAHDQATWPIQGHYACRTCLRRFPVAWERKGR